MNFLDNLEERLNDPIYTYEDYVRHVGVLHAIPEEKLNLNELRERPISEWPTREEEEDEEFAQRFAKSAETAPKDPSRPHKRYEDPATTADDPFIQSVEKALSHARPAPSRSIKSHARLLRHRRDLGR